MKKVVIEIDGVRHKLVSDKTVGDVCSQCSLAKLCNHLTIMLCETLKKDTHFEIEKEKK